ncbi:MAG: AAA family ATPase [Opitutaceae bacterium]|nr:AAA family ATPase [Verrucomicrobiales bacterium]
MNLRKITLTDFRCFDSLTLNLHEKLTVLVAENAGGKTSILDAVSRGLAAWNQYLDSAEQRLPLLLLDDGDLRVSPSKNNRGREIAKLADAAYVALVMDDGSDTLSWDLVHKLHEDVVLSREFGDSQLKSRANLVRDAIHDGDTEIPLPVFAYYGIHRGHVTQEIPDRIHEPKVDYTRRTAALVDALDPNLRDFSEIIRWFKEASLDELQWGQDRVDEAGYPTDDETYRGALPHVRRAFEAVLGDRVSNPRIDRISKKFTVDFRGQDGTVTPLRLDQLSQGYASVLALVLDLAQRLAIANSHFNAATEHDYREGVEEIINPLAAPAIVLIDEVDLHLHPSWQQRVLADLMRAFPGTQFIVTTHSPQVLTTVSRENIRILGRNSAGNWEAVLPPQEIKGVESAVALIDVMGVNPIPPVDEAKWLGDYTAKIENGTHEDAEGRALHDKLVDLYGPQHPIILDADRLIRFQGFKLRKGTGP